MRRVKNQMSLRWGIAGPWLRERRKKMGLSQKGLAKRTGVSVWLIRKYEIGGRLLQDRDFSHLRSIFQALGHSLDEFEHELLWSSEPCACWKTSARNSRRVKMSGLKSSVVTPSKPPESSVNGKRKAGRRRAIEITLTIAI